MNITSHGFHPLLHPPLLHWAQSHSTEIILRLFNFFVNKCPSLYPGLTFSEQHHLQQHWFSTWPSWYKPQTHREFWHPSYWFRPFLLLSPSPSCTTSLGEPLCQTAGAAAIFPRALQRVGTVVSHRHFAIAPLDSEAQLHPRALPILQAFTGFLASLTSALPVHEPLLPRPLPQGACSSILSAGTSNPHCVCFVSSLNPRQAQIQ